MASTASYVLLVKVLNPPRNPDPGNTVIDVFAQALQNAAEQTGSEIGSANIAQGVYDFVVDVTVDVDAYSTLNPGAGTPTPQQVATGFAAALAHNAGVVTETLPIMPMTDPVVADVVHSCTTGLENEACIGTIGTDDSRTLSLTNYVDAARVQTASATFTASQIPGNWGMLGNKRSGDCTFAAAGHAIMQWAAPSAPLPALTSDDVMGAYTEARQQLQASRSANGRLSPSPAGITAMAALNYWRKTGISGHRIEAYATVPKRDPAWVKYAIETFKCVYVVLALPAAVLRKGMSAADAPPWDEVPADGVEGELNLSNSHCVIYTGYRDDNTMTAITWGRPMPTSWQFHLDYCDEMYVAFPPGLGGSLGGVNIDQWLADARAAEGEPRPESDS